MMKEIFFVSNGLPGGGAERVMSVIANCLVDKGYEVNFIMLRNVPEEYELNQKIKRFYLRGDNSPVNSIKFIRKFMNVSEEGVFISFFTYQSFYTILASIGKNAKVIVSERNDPRKTVSNKQMEIIRNIFYGCKKCERIVFQTEGARDFFPRCIRKKGSIILNPLKTDVLNYKATLKNKEVVAVGRLTEQKNYPLLLRAFADFHRTHNNYVLKIFGQGEQEQLLRQLTLDLNIQEYVVFAGFQDDVYKQIVSASMFVISSDYEGLSNALLEAMAIGLPCISTDSPPGGAKMVIRDGINGLLTPVGDWNSLANAMRYIADNPEVAEKMGKKAYLIREKISVNNICEQWIKILEE